MSEWIPPSDEVAFEILSKTPVSGDPWTDIGRAAVALNVDPKMTFGSFMDYYKGLLGRWKAAAERDIDLHEADLVLLEAADRTLEALLARAKESGVSTEGPIGVIVSQLGGWVVPHGPDYVRICGIEGLGDLPILLAWIGVPA